MAKGYVIYNPLAGKDSIADNIQLLRLVLEDNTEYFDITRITNYASFLGGMAAEDYIVLLGGDGTLNRFINDTQGVEILPEVLYFPTGTGNDFATDLGHRAFDVPFSISAWLKGLPQVEVKGKSYRFLNGVGFGIDGYCCQTGDEQKKKRGKKVNYAAIAIRGLLFDFHPRKAKITVDRKMYAYEQVWLAPTMLGRHYGGGMIPTPAQDRASGKLSVMVFHGVGKLRALLAFPGIFKGTHVKHTKAVAIHTGYEITVEFDRPTPLQIDGETILRVTKYTARAECPNIHTP